LSNIFLAASIASIFLHTISVIKHINLSNEQLNAIVHDNELSQKVKTRFDEILH